MAAGFLTGVNITTLAKYRIHRGWIVRLLNHSVPGAYTYEIMRAKFIDEVVQNESTAGLDELILLGAGLDSRAYRLAEHLDGARVFEVDHPASLASKRARLRRLLGKEPDHVTFVAVESLMRHGPARSTARARWHTARPPIRVRRARTRPSPVAPLPAGRADAGLTVDRLRVIHSRLSRAISLGSSIMGMCPTPGSTRISVPASRLAIRDR
jgi:hypothetical protein